MPSERPSVNTLRRDAESLGSSSWGPGDHTSINLRSLYMVGSKVQDKGDSRSQGLEDPHAYVVPEAAKESYGIRCLR